MLDTISTIHPADTKGLPNILDSAGTPRVVTAVREVDPVASWRDNRSLEGERGPSHLPYSS